MQRKKNVPGAAQGGAKVVASVTPPPAVPSSPTIKRHKVFVQPQASPPTSQLPALTPPNISTSWLSLWPRKERIPHHWSKNIDQDTGQPSHHHHNLHAWTGISPLTNCAGYTGAVILRYRSCITEVEDPEELPNPVGNTIVDLPRLHVMVALHQLPTW